MNEVLDRQVASGSGAQGPGTGPIQAFMAEEFDRPTSNQGQKVDERPTADSNDARNLAIFESLATGSGSAILGHTG
jgi:hypothetical protein